MNKHSFIFFQACKLEFLSYGYSPVNLALKLWKDGTNSLVSVFLISESQKIWAEKKTRIQGTHLCHKLRNTLLKSQIIYCLNSGISLKNVGNTLLMYIFVFHSRSKFLLDKKKKKLVAKKFIYHFSDNVRGVKKRITALNV